MSKEEKRFCNAMESVSNQLKKPIISFKEWFKSLLFGIFVLNIQIVIG
jgi:hypothetical protein